MRRLVIGRRRPAEADETEETPAPETSRRRTRAGEEELKSGPWWLGWRSIASFAVSAGLMVAMAASDIAVERIDAVAPWIAASLAVGLGAKDLPGVVGALRALADGLGGRRAE